MWHTHTHTHIYTYQKQLAIFKNRKYMKKQHELVNNQAPVYTCENNTKHYVFHVSGGLLSSWCCALAITRYMLYSSAWIRRHNIECQWMIPAIYTPRHIAPNELLAVKAGVTIWLDWRGSLKTFLTPSKYRSFLDTAVLAGREGVALSARSKWTVSNPASTFDARLFIALYRYLIYRAFVYLLNVSFFRD